MKTSFSKNTNPVWCAACARSLPRVHALSVSVGSGPPPLGTTREASAVSQSAFGCLHSFIK